MISVEITQHKRGQPILTFYILNITEDIMSSPRTAAFLLSVETPNKEIIWRGRLPRFRKKKGVAALVAEACSKWAQEGGGSYKL